MAEPKEDRRLISEFSRKYNAWKKRKNIKTSFCGENPNKEYATRKDPAEARSLSEVNPLEDILIENEDWLAV
jgi:hypothetical protein